MWNMDVSSDNNFRQARLIDAKEAGSISGAPAGNDVGIAEHAGMRGFTPTMF